jgi:hypothetical protein
MKLLHPGTRTLWAIVSIGLVFALATGCGGPYTGTVTGKVTYKGTPLPGGIVTFIHPDGRIGQATIKEDGSYTVEQAPGGDVKCTVQTVKPIPAVPKSMASKLPGGGHAAEPVYPAGKYVRIPEKYSKPETSGLNLTVHRGSQNYDISLTD